MHARWHLRGGGLLALIISLWMVSGGCSDDDIPPKHDATLTDTSAHKKADVSADLQADLVQPDQSAPKCSGSAVFHPATQTCVSTVDLGADCANGQGVCSASCLQGQTCITYPTATDDFCTCAIACGPDPKNVCPDGYHCTSTSDTPKTCTPR